MISSREGLLLSALIATLYRQCSVQNFAIAVEYSFICQVYKGKNAKINFLTFYERVVSELVISSRSLARSPQHAKIKFTTQLLLDGRESLATGIFYRARERQFALSADRLRCKNVKSDGTHTQTHRFYVESSY